MPTQDAIATVLDILRTRNPCRIMEPVAHDQYAAEAFSLAALHEQERLTTPNAAIVFRFWHPHITPQASPEFEAMLEEINTSL